MVIDEGLSWPWPLEALAAVARFRQGDLVEAPPFLYYAAPDIPIWEMTKRYTESSEGPEPIEVTGAAAPPYGMITTQTCDMAEEGRERPVKPWIQVAPVFEVQRLPSGKQKQIQLGRILYLIHLPDSIHNFGL